MSSVTISEAQAALAAILAGLHHPPLGAAAALSEETGETSKILLDHHGYGKPLDKSALAGELADVFVCLAEIATLHGIDLGEAVSTKVDDLAKRAPKWRTDISGALDAAWKGAHGNGARRPDAPTD